jgi:hypothetical protein
MAEVLVLDDGREVPLEELGFSKLVASDGEGARYALFDPNGEKLGEIYAPPGRLGELLSLVKAEASAEPSDAS